MCHKMIEDQVWRVILRLVRHSVGRMGKLLWIFMRHQFGGVAIGVMQEVFWLQSTAPLKLFARCSFFKISISNDSSYCVFCQVPAWWCCCNCTVRSAHWDCQWLAQFPLTLWINHMDGLPMISFNYWHLGYEKRTGLTRACVRVLHCSFLKPIWLPWM